MEIYLGGNLNFYHPQKQKWLEVEFDQPTSLVTVLQAAGIPLGEIQLVVINGEIAELSTATITDSDQVKLFPPVGGG